MVNCVALGLLGGFIAYYAINQQSFLPVEGFSLLVVLGGSGVGFVAFFSAKIIKNFVDDVRQKEKAFNNQFGNEAQGLKAYLESSEIDHTEKFLFETKAQPQKWLVLHQRRICMFTSAEAREKFMKKPETISEQ